MYPSISSHKHRSLAARKHQQGFLIPLAIFIVVVMGLLALALTRTTTQTSLATAQELVSVQAIYAAESGAQHGMNALFYPDPSDRNQVSARCVGLNENLNFSGVAGLSGCSAALTCACENCVSAALTSIYTITSVGQCGAGVISAVRTVRVGAFLDRAVE